MGTIGPEQEDEAEQWVVEFIGLHSRGDRSTPEEFVARIPEPLRANVRERCRIYLGTLRKWETPGSGPLPESLGPYRLERQLGVGGMGAVHLAHAPDGRRVALKVLHPNLAPDEASVRRFAREARTAGSLDHPGIVSVIDSGYQAPWHYLVMEFVEGGNLAQLLRQEGSPGLEPTRAAMLVRDVALALEHAHSNGVVHRDVKPQNILIDPGGRARLSDFGLAQVESSRSFTRSGQLIGTLNYMSPEQALARRVKIDRRTDVYSLGVVLYELLTGKRPFDSESQQDLYYAITFVDPEPPSSLSRAIPRDLERVCLQAMEKRPSDRYRTAGELATDLERILRQESPVARKPTLLVRIWRRTLRRPMRAMLAAGTVGACALAAWAYGAGVRERTLSAWVTLAKRLDSAVFELRAFRLDPLTHAAVEEIELRLQPDEPQRLEPGIFRFVVRRRSAPGHDFAELTRALEAAQEVVLEPRIVDSGTAQAGMLRIPAGTYHVGASEPFPDYALEVTTDGFLIDRTETSNADYAEFLATEPDAPRPENWPEGSLTEEWLRRPVILLPFEAVQRYCEWRGKRLPTWIEWEIAATGPSPRLFPWGDEPTGRAVVSQPLPQAPPEAPGYVRFGYLEGTVPIDESAGDDVSPFGLLHTYGNVREWTECYLVRPGAPNFARRQTRGFAWHDSPAVLHPLAHLQDAPNDSITMYGFRCARSIDAEKSLQLSFRPRTEERR